jgi:hypothetical protein
MGKELTQAVQKEKKRKPRSKFRPTFKSRCVYSFCKSLEAYSEIQELMGDEDSGSESLGMAFISCYKSLSNSIEMLCKATLEQRSLFLVLENLDHFDTMYPNDKALSQHTCGAFIGLARASKLFRTKFDNSELGQLNRILDSRNQAEHNEFHIQAFDKEIHYLVSAFQIIVKIYDNQFREGDLIKEASEFASHDISSVYERAIEENSKEFKIVSAKVKELEKKGTEFTRCINCYYPFAALGPDKKSYNCMWCNDERIKKTCTDPSCKNEFWIPKDSAKNICDGIHLTSFLNLKNPVEPQSALRGTILGGPVEGSSVLDEIWKSLTPGLGKPNPWALDKPANPKSEDAEANGAKTTPSKEKPTK